LIKLVYWFGMLAQIFIRAPFAIKARSRKRNVQRASLTENIVLGLLTVGSLLLPLIYSVTRWLAFADYRLPATASWAGILILIASLLVFWRAHADLDANWSPSLEMYEGHTLITSGIYRQIRHPMYASQFIWSIAQMLLIQNWIAGPAGLIVLVPFYLLRRRAEETMMLEQFGDQYREYLESTGSILPKL
ncbi:MAG TPA: protein-S-isoprenylcysteine O-methyltransferase, partial [Anaerolineales bacterium]